MSSQIARDAGRRIDRMAQRSRRVVAVMTLVGLPSMYVWSWLWQGTSVSPLLWGPITFALIGSTLIGAFILYRFVRDRADMPGRRLDERERQLRDQAWILSYQVLAIVLVVGVAAVGVAVLGFGGTVKLDATAVGALTLSVSVLLPVLPAAALAWIEPDYPDAI